MSTSESGQSKQSKIEDPSEMSKDVESTGIVNRSKKASSTVSDVKEGVSGHIVFIMARQRSLCLWCCSTT